MDRLIVYVMLQAMVDAVFCNGSDRYEALEWLSNAADVYDGITRTFVRCPERRAQLALFAWAQLEE